MLSFLFVFVLLYDTIRTCKTYFFNSFVAARCARDLKICLENPKHFRFVTQNLENGRCIKPISILSPLN